MQTKVSRIVRDNMPLITGAMEGEEEGLTKKFAEGGMTITRGSSADVEQGMKLIAPFWDDWAKSKGPDAVEALKKVRAALGR